MRLIRDLGRRKMRSTLSAVENEIVLADEPTGNLDSGRASAVLAFLRQPSGEASGMVRSPR